MHPVQDTSPTSGAAANKLDLAGVVALVAPLVATVGLFQATGAIGRIQREEPVWLLIAVALVLVAGVLLTIASYLKGVGQTAESKTIRRLFIAGTVVAVIGFGLAIELVVTNASQESRPRISGSFDRASSTFTGEISASNLSTDRLLAVKVDLQTVTEGQGIDDPRPWSPTGSLPMERVYVGPNPDGDVKHEITVPVLNNGLYTHIVVEATTEDGDAPCIEFQDSSGPDDRTACMFIPLTPTA